MTSDHVSKEKQSLHAFFFSLKKGVVVLQLELLYFSLKKGVVVLQLELLFYNWTGSVKREKGLLATLQSQGKEHDTTINHCRTHHK